MDFWLNENLLNFTFITVECSVVITLFNLRDKYFRLLFLNIQCLLQDIQSRFSNATEQGSYQGRDGIWQIRWMVLMAFFGILIEPGVTN